LKLDLNNESENWSESSDNYKKNEDSDGNQQDSDAFDIDPHGRILAYCKGNKIIF
jgi:hypothetical protein